MNTLVKNLVELIAAVAVLLLIINFMFPGLLSGLISGSGITNNPSVKFSEKPVINIFLAGKDDDLRNYEYSIVFPGAGVEYQGTMEDAYGPLEGLHIIPVIDFKGVSKKAFVDGLAAPFYVSNIARTFEGTFSAELLSSLPPLEPGPLQPDLANPFDGTLKAGDTIVLKSGENNLSVRLAKMVKEETGFWSFLPYSQDSICFAIIDINCGEPVTLKMRKGCEEDKTDCDRYLKICNADVRVLVTDTNCGSKTANIHVEFSGGMEYNSDDVVGVSFWRKSICTDKGYTSYTELWDHCGDDFLGRSVFNEDVQVP